MDSGYRVGGYNSLELDAANRPHIAYYDWATYVLKYAHYDGSTWQVETVDNQGAVGQYCSLGLDAAGLPHISYFDMANYDLKYAWHDGAAWQFQVADAGENTGTDTSLVLDPSGHPYVGYQSNGRLKVAHYDGAAWQSEVADGGETVGQFASLALDAAGRPHLSHYDWSARTLRYTHCEGAVQGGPAGTWHTEVVDTAGRVGEHSSIAVDGAGWPHISYYDPVAGHLRYARYDGSAWRVEVVAQPGNVGMYSSLRLDAAGRPHISYYDASDGDLRYARSDGVRWYTATVDGPGDVGRYTSLAVDGAGRPHVSYFAGANGGLRYAYNDGTRWYTATVDSVGEAGEYSSLALDTAGRPHISYYQALDGLLRYAYHDGTRWYSATVDHGSVGQYTSLALDRFDRPHIAYYDGAHAALRYAYFDGQSWYTTTVDSAGDVGTYASLALDAYGDPHVGYADASTGDLRYAQYDGLAWQTERVDWADEVGRYSALALDQAGQAHLSYYDGTWGDLKYARQTCTPVSAARVGGPQRLAAGTTGVYTGTALPPTAAPTPTLSWDNGTVGPTATYGWADAGTYTVSLTATNACGSARAALEVLVCRALEGLEVAGPAGLEAGAPGTYTAAYTPPDATLPVTLSWDNGAVGPTTTYSWTVPGRYAITATAAGPCNRLQVTRTVEVTCVALAAVQVAGPQSLLVQQEGTYVAAYSPPTATPPVSFTWDNGTAGETAVYSWTRPGNYSVTVTATAPCGQLPASLGVEVRVPLYRIYLPLVRRGPSESESLKFYREWFTNPPTYPEFPRRLFEPGSLGDMPLAVLTSPHKERAADLPAGLSDKWDEIWVELQREWAQISSRSTHIMAYESGHFIQHDQPDLVIDAIRQVVTSSR